MEDQMSTNNKRALWSVLALVALGALPRSAAAGQPAVPLVFKNQTNAPLRVEIESVVESNGDVVAVNGTWDLKPRFFGYLTTPRGKLYAKAVNFRVLGARGSSSWNCKLVQVDQDGDFVVIFTPADYREHLRITGGIRPAVGVPALPPAAAGPTPPQIQNAAGKIGLAVLADLAARKILEDTLANPNANPFEKDLARGAAKIAREARDALIQSALRDLFPRLTPRQAGDIQFLISQAADGRLNIANLNQQEAKQRLINDLRAISPDLANAAAVADLIFAIYQGSRR
jgi:hypothetical protein